MSGKRWLLAMVSVAAAPLVAAPPLVQLPGTAGCVSESGTGGQCADGPVVLDGARDVEVSPDGRSVYIVSTASEAVVAAFDRNPITGALTPKGGASLCVSIDGSAGLCTDGVAMDLPTALAISPDGRNVYLTSFDDDSVVVLDRNVATGQLTPKTKVGLAACFNLTGAEGCTVGRGLAEAIHLAVSPDGRNVYVVGSLDNAIAIFDRDVSTGGLTQKMGTAGCVDELGADGCADGVALEQPKGVTVSGDGRQVYVASATSGAVAVFDRDPGTGVLTQKTSPAGCVSKDSTGGSCIGAPALDGTQGVAVSSDGVVVYVTLGAGALDGVSVFDRNVSTGVLAPKLSPNSCIIEGGDGIQCAPGVALDGALRVVESVDGRSVYVAAPLADAVAVFDRDPTTGMLMQKPGPPGCISDTGTAGTCTDGRALSRAAGVTVSPDGRNVYVASLFSDAVAVFTTAVTAYDVDGDGEVEPLTDSLLLLRYNFGFTGAPLITGAVDLVNCTRCTAELIVDYIEAGLEP